MRLAQRLEIHAFPRLKARYPILSGLAILVISTAYGVVYGFPGQDMEVEAVYEFYTTWHIAWCFMRIGLLFIAVGFLFACFRAAPTKRKNQN